MRRYSAAARNALSSKIASRRLKFDGIILMTADPLISSGRLPPSRGIRWLNQEQPYLPLSSSRHRRSTGCPSHSRFGSPSALRKNGWPPTPTAFCTLVFSRMVSHPTVPFRAMSDRANKATAPPIEQKARASRLLAEIFDHCAKDGGRSLQYRQLRDHVTGQYREEQTCGLK